MPTLNIENLTSLLNLKNERFVKGLPHIHRFRITSSGGNGVIRLTLEKNIFSIPIVAGSISEIAQQINDYIDRNSEDFYVTYSDPEFGSGIVNLDVIKKVDGPSNGPFTFIDSAGTSGVTATSVKNYQRGSVTSGLELLQSYSASQRLFDSSENEFVVNKTYNSIDELPDPEPNLEGMIVLLQSEVPYRDNGLFVCTGYQWYNIFDLDSGNPEFPGYVAGFVSGGEIATPTYVNKIEKFNFASQAVVTDHGDLTTAVHGNSGASSEAKGYSLGGQNTGAALTSTIEAFPFANASTAAGVGSFSKTQYLSSSHASLTDNNGFASASFDATTPGTYASVDVEKFSLSSEQTAVDIADMTTGRYSAAGISSSTTGYIAGGQVNGTNVPKDQIESFSFASPVVTSSVGTLTVAKTQVSGQSSATDGYVAGGVNSSITTKYTDIESFPFAAPPVTSTDVGDLSAERQNTIGISSRDFGYVAGGFETLYVDTIERYPFAGGVGLTSTGVGVLSEAKRFGAGHQY